MNEHPSPEFEKELRETLGEPNANPVFVRDLRATLIERSTMKQKRSSFARLAWGLAVALLFALSVVASPRAAAMLKQLLGYVPGVGFVQSDETLRVLAAPVTVNQAGVQVSIENGTADAQHTILLQRIEGAASPDPSSARFCHTPAQLVLPDGTSMKEISYETSWTDGGDHLGRYEFEALPAGQLEAVLEIPCVLYDATLTDFRFELHFKLADASQVLPVIELPTDPAPPANPATASVSPAASPIEGFAIVLESETALADGYLLTGSYRWTDPRFDGFSAYPTVVQITDANGDEVNVEPAEPVEMNTDPAGKKLPFAFHIPGKDQAFPLTISVDSVIVTLPDTATFQFDFGASPQVGQTWNAELDVPIAGRVVRVQTIQLTAGRTPTELGFTFVMISDDGVTGATVLDARPIINNPPGGGGGGGGGGGADGGYSVGPFAYSWAIEGYSPAGVKTFVLSDVAVMLHGTWQATWEPTVK